MKEAMPIATTVPQRGTVQRDSRIKDKGCQDKTAKPLCQTGEIDAARRVKDLRWGVRVPIVPS